MTKKTWHKSDVYAIIALILMVICFAFPSMAFYKVPQKIQAGQIDAIPSYVYPLWNTYQKGRYVSPFTPKEAAGDLKKMIETKAEIGMMSMPIWFVSLEAPNYPKSTFPEGIPIWFHADGFSGDVHEMDTINLFGYLFQVPFSPSVFLRFLQDGCTGMATTCRRGEPLRSKPLLQQPLVSDTWRTLRRKVFPQ